VPQKIKLPSLLAVEILGTCAFELWNKGHNQCFLIKDNSHAYLFDAGSISALSYEYRAVFITHYHIDHTRYLLKLKTRVIVGPEVSDGMELDTSKGGKIVRYDAKSGLDVLKKLFEFKQVNCTKPPHVVYDDETIQVTSIPVNHAVGLFCTGYLVKNKATGNHIWISGDFGSMANDSINAIKKARPVQSFIELTYPDSYEPDGHQSYFSALRLVKELGIPDYRFVHLSYRWADIISERGLTSQIILPKIAKHREIYYF